MRGVIQRVKMAGTRFQNHRLVLESCEILEIRINRGVEMKELCGMDK